MTSPLRLPVSDVPEVSVVLVTYGQWGWTRRALEALAAHTADPFEVLVVDNASPDGTVDALVAETEGVRLFRNETNEGFGAGTNRGVREARGRFVCLLNSDALVQPGWLPPLRAALKEPGVGAAAPMFLGEDGRVLEAGSSVGSDGATDAWGRGLDPSDPSVSFPRTVDFASAACLLLRRDDLLDAGGFHPDYGIGYVEDVDLCLTLAARGGRTVFVPASRVIHAGSASSDPATAAVRMATNRRVLVRRHAAALAGRPSLGRLEGFEHRRLHARDWLAPVRVTVLAGPDPRAEGGVDEAVPARPDPFGEALGKALVDIAGTSRVTVLGGPAEEHLAPAGVEALPMPEDPERWWISRLGHASAVVVRGAGAAMAGGPGLLATQPQAVVVYDLTAPAGPRARAEAVVARAAEATLLRSADVVVVDDSYRAAFARELAPGAAVVRMRPGDAPAAVRHALVLAGASPAPS